MIGDLWDIFIAFTRASNLGFGGGPAVIPLIQAEAVDRYQWITNSQFADALAVANALPGPIATKLAAYVGYQVAGWLGALVGILGTIGPTLLAVVLLTGLLMKYANSPRLKGMLKAVRPVVVVLIAQTALDMGWTSFPTLATWFIALGAVLLLMKFKIHPALVILLSMFTGFVLFR